MLGNDAPYDDVERMRTHLSTVGVVVSVGVLACEVPFCEYKAIQETVVCST